jgi:hypothetical protein
MKETAAELESLLRDISYWIKKKGRDALSSVRITLPQFQVLQLVYFGEAVNVTKQGSSIIRKVIRQRVQTVQEITRLMKPGSADYLVTVLTEFVELCGR